MFIKKPKFVKSPLYENSDGYQHYYPIKLALCGAKTPAGGRKHLPECPECKFKLATRGPL